jgi:hypothetical protein
MRIVITCVIFLCACIAEDLVPDVGAPIAGSCDDADSDPLVVVSFAHDIRPLMDRESMAAGCGCHTPTNGTPSGISLGGLDLGSYESLRVGGFNSGAEVVVPGEPCSSLLVDKLSPTPSWGARMPYDGPPYLTEEEQQLVKDWIAEGANDN